MNFPLQTGRTGRIMLPCVTGNVRCRAPISRYNSFMRKNAGPLQKEREELVQLEGSVILRPMTPQDFDEVHDLWMTIQGFGIRSLDDGKEDVTRFIKRNPTTSVVAVSDGRIVGSILCGNDGRQGCLYHVCVEKQFRRMGIGTQMVGYCMRELRELGINKVTLVAFKRNDGGNAFWRKIGWKKREDFNYYEFVLNEKNITKFIGADQSAMVQ